jgi:hypothetical protein
MLLQKRSTEKVDTQKNKEEVELIKLKKSNLSDKLMNQIKKSLWHWTPRNWGFLFDIYFVYYNKKQNYGYYIRKNWRYINWG